MTVPDLVAFASAGCRKSPYQGVDWDRGLPLAPAAAIAEWIRREPCDVCGVRGCATVASVTVMLYPDDDGDEVEVEAWEPDVCEECLGSGTFELAYLARTRAEHKQGAPLERLAAWGRSQPCDVCDGDKLPRGR
jgi:hypothetical protein